MSNNITINSFFVLYNLNKLQYPAMKEVMGNGVSIIIHSIMNISKRVYNTCVSIHTS